MRMIWVFVFLLLSMVSSGLAEQTPLTDSLGKEVVDAGNTICPISGDPVNPEVTTVYQGKRYSFCCPNCTDKFKKNPEKYLAKMAGKEKASETVEHEHAGHEHAGHEAAG